MDPVVAVCLVLIVIGIVGFFVAKKGQGGQEEDVHGGLSLTTMAPGAAAGAGNAAPAVDPSTLHPMLVFYGSQTGTAEGFAKQIANEATRHGFFAKQVDLEDFTPEALMDAAKAAEKPPVAVFMMATYGEGDPTDNAVDFSKWVKDKAGDLEPNSLATLHFTVFGLGNRQYEHYNAMGRLVDKRMEELGGSRVYKYGEGDDDGTLEEDFDSWKEGFWAGLREAMHLTGEDAGAASGNDLTPPDLEWAVVNVGQPDAGTEATLLQRAQEAYTAAGVNADMASRHYFSAKPVVVRRNTELRQAPSVVDSTKHIELDLSASGLGYGTADDLAVLPENDPKLVESVARWLEYDLDQWFTLEPAVHGASPKPMFPTPCTVRTALTRYCDLGGVPRKQLLGYLSTFAGKQAHADRLRQLSSSEGKQEFHEWVVEPQRSIYEVFQEFPSVKPPLERFLQLVPRLAVRYYTIASSPVLYPSTVHLAVSIIRTPKPGDHKSRELVGVCSNFLASRCLPADSESKTADRATSVVYCHVRASNFKLPADPSVPVVLVGPGTGLAPMRAFLQERRHQRASGAAVGDTIVFFGCRNREQDYIYKEELEDYAADGTATALYTAFSREQAEKVYVQHRLKEHGAQVWAALHDANGHVYVCGATRMGDDVKAALLEVAQEHGGLSADAAKAYVDDMSAKERYIQELWS